MVNPKLSLVLKWIATILIGLSGLFFLLFGVGESIEGMPGGWIHLVPAVVMLACIPLGWKFQLWGGLIQLALFFLIGYQVYILLIDTSINRLHFQPLLGLPFLISGTLLLISAALNEKVQTLPSVN